ncbi:MAG: threonylcarbamoyl-AMP synthase [Tissierellia bacterium]|nr:threonylcarbamoyl-AMP synthase [Tissierellia bacterium]
METKIVKIDEKKLDINELLNLSKIIKEGGLVGIPTETVYGLAANGLDGNAVSKIFRAKNRPMDNPLILHISQMDQIYSLTKDVNKEDIEKLNHLWPGPLTVVLNKSEKIPFEVSCGLDTVAIRMPSKELTRKFIELCGTPLAAPSANLSTKPSPTTAYEVYEDMHGKIDAIIDGGKSSIGLESTVLDLTSKPATILRPGYYTKEMLEEYWPGVDYDLALKNENQIPKSPGQKYKHYAPKAEVIVYIGKSEHFTKKVNDLLQDKDKRIGVMAFEEDGNFEKADFLIDMGSKEDLTKMGNILFSSLRDMDHEKMDLIIVHGVEENSYGLSIMNRLKKSASGRVYYLED